MIQALRPAPPEADAATRLSPVTRKIALEGFRLPVDIGFHDFEVGSPQMVDVTVEVWLDEMAFPRTDAREDAWDYDFLRTSIQGFAAERRYNLQETFARAIFDLIAARPGVSAIRVKTSKPDVYPDARAVGVEIASF